MTEAVRPRPGLAPGRAPTDRPALSRAGASGAIAGAKPVAGARPVAARRTAEARRPYHVGVFLGLSAGLYAVSLAGVTTLESSSEQAVSAAQAPAVSAIRAVSAGHDDLERQVAASGSAYEAAAGRYQRAASELGSLESQLESLSASVGRVTGVTSALPNHVALPSLPKLPAVTAPAVHATTTASGQPLP